MAEKLLEVETMDLLDIIELIGERPYPMQEYIKSYISEIKESKRLDAENKLMKLKALEEKEKQAKLDMEKVVGEEKTPEESKNSDDEIDEDKNKDSKATKEK